jgi:hypothetical protein
MGKIMQKSAAFPHRSRGYWKMGDATHGRAFGRFIGFMATSPRHAHDGAQSISGILGAPRLGLCWAPDRRRESRASQPLRGAPTDIGASGSAAAAGTTEAYADSHGLSLSLVSTIPPAARELGVPIPDLQRLTWARPKLLEEALEEHELAVSQAMGVVIQALYGDDLRRQTWASDKIMSSWLARDSPLAPARRGRGVEAPEQQVVFRWRSPDEATLERDGRMIAVPRYGGATPPALGEHAAPTPSPLPLSKWPGLPDQPRPGLRRRMSRGR